MKGIDRKTLVFAGMILVQSCVSTTQKTKSQLSDTMRYPHPTQTIREDHINEQEVPNGSKVSGQTSDRIAIAQQKSNDCGKTCEAMIVNHYLNDSLSAREVEQEWSQKFPLAYQFNERFLDGQDLFVHKIAKYLNHKLQDTQYQVRRKSSNISDQQLLLILDDGGSAMVAIHSKMGYPHWVIIIGYHYDQNRNLLYKVLNPSGTLILEDKELCYNDKTGDQDCITKTNNPAINIITSTHLRELRKSALLNTGFDRKENVGVIIIEKENHVSK